MKTLKLIEQYKKIFLEQDAVEEVDVNVDVEADATDVADKLQKYGRTEPREVITTIEEMLAISDEPVEQELEALDAQ